MILVNKQRTLEHKQRTLKTHVTQISMHGYLVGYLDARHVSIDLLVHF